MDLTERLMAIAFGFVSTAFVVILVIVGVDQCRTYHRCVDNGGHFVRVNCHTVEDQICTTNDYGNNMMITTCMPTTSTHCDEVCVGTTPEARE